MVLRYDLHFEMTSIYVVYNSELVYLMRLNILNYAPNNITDLGVSRQITIDTASSPGLCIARL
jgi:hypothetical protein